MSDKNSEGLTTPKERVINKGSSFKEVYLNSLQKRKNALPKCSLCLLCSSDCSNFRCHNKSHYVCSQCACDWQADKLCPVCKNSSIASSYKPLSSKSIFASQIQEQHSPFHFISLKSQDRQIPDLDSKKALADGSRTMI